MAEVLENLWIFYPDFCAPGDDKLCKVEKGVDITDDCPQASGNKRCILLFAWARKRLIVQVRSFQDNRVVYYVDDVERLSCDENFCSLAKDAGIGVLYLISLIVRHAPVENHESDTKSTVMLSILVLLLGLAILVIGLIVKGYVLGALWGWFIVPVFGLPKLSVPSAIGIALIVSYLTTQKIETNNGDKGVSEKYGKQVIIAILYPLFILFLSWIIHQFFM